MKASVKNYMMTLLVTLPYGSMDSVFNLYENTFYPLYDQDTGLMLIHKERFPFVAHSMSGDFYLLLESSDMASTEKTGRKFITTSNKRFALNEVSRQR